MKLSEALTPILLAALILVVMISAALQQQSDKQTQKLLAQLTDQLGESTTVVMATPDQPRSDPDGPTDPQPPQDTDTNPTGDVDPDATAADTDADSDVDAAAGTSDDTASGTPDSTALSELDWPTFGPTVEQIIRQLLTGQYDAVYSRFNDDMRDALPLRTLTEVMNPLRDKHGAFDSIVRHSAPVVRLPEGLHAFRVTVATKKTTDEPLVFTITLDEEKRIAGLYVR
jgi:hypothetical protein